MRNYLPYPCLMDEARIRRLADRFDREKHEGVVSVYLFGSHAEGRAHQESDVDIGVLLHHEKYPTARSRFEARLRLMGETGSVLENNEVDLVILNDATPELGARVVTDGMRIFCSDEEVDHDFVRDIQLRAADLRPFLDRMRRIKLEAIKR